MSESGNAAQRLREPRDKRLVLGRLLRAQCNWGSEMGKAMLIPDQKETLNCRKS